MEETSLRTTLHFPARVALARRTFKNWFGVGVLATFGDGGIMPSMRPIESVARHRHRFRTRLGPELVTEVGNSAPIFEVFAKKGYAAPIDWEKATSILDVGAHIGSFTCWAAILAPSARFVAVEPDARNLEDLAANLRLNGLETRVRTIAAAVAASKGTRSLSGVIGRNRYSSSITVDRGGPRVDVPTMTLENLIAKEFDGHVDVLKMDCEGAEWEIFESTSDETWARVHHIVMECHLGPDQRLADIESMLLRAGFTPRLIENRGTVHEGPFRYQSAVHGRRVCSEHSTAL